MREAIQASEYLLLDKNNCPFSMEAFKSLEALADALP